VSSVARIGAPSNKALKLTSLASRDGLGSQLNAVLAGLQAAHPGSLVAGTETDSTGRDRHEMATESDVTRTT
jgi:hypothetical protein